MQFVCRSRTSIVAVAATLILAGAVAPASYGAEAGVLAQDDTISTVSYTHLTLPTN